MADQDLTHTADIIKAAIPYVDSPLKGTAELFAKFLDVMGSLKSANKPGKLAASGFLNSKIDLEGLLKGIRPVCSDKEREMVDRFLSFFNMKRAFEMYNNMMSMMKSMQDVGDFSFADAFGSNDTDNVTGNFNGAAFESIFKNFNNFSDNFSTGDSTDNPFDSETVKAADNDSDSSNSKEDSEKSTNRGSPGSEQSSAPSGAPGGMNPMMFEMLKNMVPPEQMSTIENLSMLFGNMSYDNNSKSDDSKEQNDG